MDSNKIKPTDVRDEPIIINKELSIGEAMIPVVALVLMLAYNIFIFGNNALGGSNQFILLMGAAVAAIVGFRNKVSYAQMLEEVGRNVKSTSGAILILLMVGALAGTWMISGVIPSMIYYGLKLLSPAVFLPACVVICSIISLATGSSWSTSATVGIALIGVGNSMGISPGMTAGAVLSGAYFGDKISPLSDTTNLASAMAGSTLFDHINYMLKTTIPSIGLTLLVFILLTLKMDIGAMKNIDDKLMSIENAVHISPILFIVPLTVIILILKKTEPLIALFIGALMGGIVAVIFQPDIVVQVSGQKEVSANSLYKGVMTALTTETTITTTNPEINELFTARGMEGMLGTIWLILCAMVFGGVMEAIGALTRISDALLKLFKSVFGLFVSTVASCVAINVTASDQYLAIVIPGKMYAKAYKNKGLHPVNLSRTLEDSGTVTSVLVPWNTCGAYQSGVLGVATGEYFIYAVFNWLSPIMTLIFAFFNIKLKHLKDQE